MNRQVLCNGRTYLVDNSNGGLFHGDTRHLLPPEITVDGKQQEQLAAMQETPSSRHLIHADSETTNLLQGTTSHHTGFTVRRHQTIPEEGRFNEHLFITNHSRNPFSGALTVTIETDFADIFDIRNRHEKDRSITTEMQDNALTYRYSFTAHSGTQQEYTTSITVDTPFNLDSGALVFNLDLDPQEQQHIVIDVTARSGTRDRKTHSLLQQRSHSSTLLQQSYQDLEALTTTTTDGPVPLAGTPWFMTVFGRDACITAFEALHVAPELASGTIKHLAMLQGEENDPETHEEPGKMHHEARYGEQAARHETPFRRYYGAVDTTPLWIILLTAYYRHRNQPRIVKELEDHLDAALAWVERKIDDGNDPYIYYQKTEALNHQFWKDSSDSVQQQNGVSLDPPLAIAEVQGYAYRALHGAARLLETVLDRDRRAEELRDTAFELQEQFNSDYWMEERSFYALAKTPDDYYADARTSDIGQCLWTGIIAQERAAGIVDQLMDDAFLTDHGIRTMAADSPGYSPVSYHNGSVWPHDNALVALGYARYGFQDEAGRLRTALRTAAQHHDNRLPEAFCGFDDIPVIYPSSCRPQAWAAAAPFALERAARKDVPDVAED